MSALAGASAVVTGASRGIGAAIAAALAAEGARVARLARSLEDGASGAVADYRCDVANEQDVDRARDRIVRDAGPPDILVHNAGTFLLAPFDATTPEAFRREIAINLTGAFLVFRAFLPAMRERRRGRVVMVGSVADHLALPGNAAYGAAKWGARGLHEVLAAETAGSGLQFTLVSPGPTDTAAWDAVNPDARDDLPDRAAMLRPDDVADAVRWIVTRPAHVHVPLLRIMPG